MRVRKIKHIKKVKMVDFDGRRKNVPFQTDNGGAARLQVRNCASGADYYAVEYSTAGEIE